MKKRRLVVALTLIVFALAAYALGWSNLLTVSSVEMKGTGTFLSTTIKPGERLARIEPRAVAKEYEKLDWVQRAEVSRNWINGKITITITERLPIAIFNNRAIDKDGVSFAITNQSTKGLPRIQAPSIDSAITAAAFFSALPQEIASSVQLVKVGNGEMYTLQMQATGHVIEVVWGSSQDNALKSTVYKALIARAENSKIHQLDLSAPHAPIVK
ncbi:MAG: FtsQ-type POTRA domain-containing protein [Actinomycetes bacterium]